MTSNSPQQLSLVLAIVRTTRGSLTTTTSQRMIASGDILPATYPLVTAYATDDRFFATPCQAFNGSLRSHIPPSFTSNVVQCSMRPRETNIRGLRLQYSSVDTCNAVTSWIVKRAASTVHSATPWARTAASPCLNDSARVTRPPPASKARRSRSYTARHQSGSRGLRQCHVQAAARRVSLTRKGTKGI